MNWHITTTAKALAKTEPTVELAEDEDATPNPKLVKAARTTAKAIASELKGNVHIEVHGHETTTGSGFRPAHVSVTVSKTKG